MKSHLTIKQKSLLFSFLDTAEAAPSKINQLCRITLSSKLNTNSDFSKMVEDFMDCKPSEVKQKCQEISKKLT